MDLEFTHKKFAESYAPCLVSGYPFSHSPAAGMFGGCNNPIAPPQPDQWGECKAEQWPRSIEWCIISGRSGNGRHWAHQTFISDRCRCGFCAWAHQTLISDGCRCGSCLWAEQTPSREGSRCSFCPWADYNLNSEGPPIGQACDQVELKFTSDSSQSVCGSGAPTNRGCERDSQPWRYMLFQLGMADAIARCPVPCSGFGPWPTHAHHNCPCEAHH